jgi:hypothetical protein
MSQILKLKRGSLERLSTITGSLQKGEVIFASASIGIPSSNGSSIMFTTTESGSVQATNRIMKTTGSTAPDLSNGVYNGLIDGIPYYTSGSSTLHLLSSTGNEAINLIGNIQPFSSSIDSRLDAVEQFSSSLSTTFATDLELAAVSQSISASEALVSASIANSLASIQNYFPIGVISSSQQVIDIFNANFTSGSTMASTVDTTFATDYEVYVTSSVADGGEW